MSSKSVAIAGLPGAGKTTFLAAFWHLLTCKEKPTKLRFDSVSGITTDYLDEITGKWLDGVMQKRSVDRSGSFFMLNLFDATGESFGLSFPDLSGEIFRDMWEQRAFPESIAEKFRDCAGLVFFIDGNNIQKSPLLSDIKRTRENYGEGEEDPKEYKPWDPTDAHTQAKIVDLLQLFTSTPISLPLRKLSIVISCWDKVDANRTPEGFIKEKLPLLDQYLEVNFDNWESKIYGISAQGADYERSNEESGPELLAEQKEKLEALRELDAVERILVIHRNTKSHDLSEPFAWFLN